MQEPTPSVPVHRRTVRIEIGPARGGRRAVEARLFDLRQRGVTRVGVHVKRPGPIHEMSARFEVDADGRAVRAAHGAMALAAFDGTPDTRGESCRDILPNVARLAGLAIDGTLPGAMRREIGHERGCYHLTTLILAAAPALQQIAAGSLGDGQSLIRELLLTAHDSGAGCTRFAGDLLDTRSGGPPRRAHLALTVMPPDLCARNVLAQGAPHLALRPDVAARLDGAALLAGFTREVLARLADLPACAELRDVALGLAAILTQGMLQPSPEAAPPPPERRTRAHNTCWMWRDGGPLQEMSATLTSESE